MSILDGNGVCTLCSRVIIPFNDCPEGFTGITGSCERCSPGTYCPVGGDRVPPLPCIDGHWCPSSCSGTVPCRSGYFCTSSHAYFITGIILSFVVLLIMFAIWYWRLRDERNKSKSASNSNNNMMEMMQIIGQDSSQTIPVTEDAKPSPSSSSFGTTMKIDVEDVSVCLSGMRNKGKYLLRNVSLSFKPGHLTAVMGASGAGKTITLTVLRGGLAPTAGHIKVNGRIYSAGLSALRREIGFVPQDDDSLDALLTVEEALYHSASMRLPKDLPADEKSRVVEQVISLLGLEKIRSQLIGSGKGASGGARGLSGGQRKRVSIGMEMVAKPSCLLLDEPTSGLDSTTSLSVVRALHEIAASGVICVATIHQPSQLIFDCFDDLVLMVPGGRVAYAGPRGDALPHFRTLGLEPAPLVSEPDALIDFLNAVDAAAPPPAPSPSPRPANGDSGIGFVPVPLPPISSPRGFVQMSLQQPQQQQQQDQQLQYSPRQEQQQQFRLPVVGGGVVEIRAPDLSPSPSNNNNHPSDVSDVQIENQNQEMSNVWRYNASPSASASFGSQHMSVTTVIPSTAAIHSSEQQQQQQEWSNIVIDDPSSPVPAPDVHDMGPATAAVEMSRHKLKQQRADLAAGVWQRVVADRKAQEESAPEFARCAATVAIMPNNDTSLPASSPTAKIAERSTPFFIRQIGMQLVRLLRSESRRVPSLIINSLMFAFTGVYLGIAFTGPKYELPMPSTITCPQSVLDLSLKGSYNQPCSPTWPSYEYQGQAAMYLCMGLGIVAASFSVRTLGEDKLNYYRQVRSGCSAAAIFIAKMALDTCWSIMFALFFLSPYYLISTPYGLFGEYFVLCAAFIFANFGIGYVLSVFLSYQNAATFATIFSCAAGVTCGLVFQFAPVWTFYFSEGLFRSEITFIVDTVTASDLPFLATYADQVYGYSVDDVIAIDTIKTVMWGVGFRVAAFIGLLLWRRDLQK